MEQVLLTQRQFRDRVGHALANDVERALEARVGIPVTRA